MTSTPPSRGAPISAGVHFPPPLFFLFGFLVGWLLNRVHALPVLPPSTTAREPVGLVLVGAGLLFMFWALVTFLAARTTVIPNRPASRLVTAGPYRFSRNPMYTGFTAVYIGFTLIINSAWPLLILPLVIMALLSMVIEREERYLNSAFGAEYAEYKGRVRRWV